MVLLSELILQGQPGLSNALFLLLAGCQAVLGKRSLAATLLLQAATPLTVLKFCTYQTKTLAYSWSLWQLSQRWSRKKLIKTERHKSYHYCARFSDRHAIKLPWNWKITISKQYERPVWTFMGKVSVLCFAHLFLSLVSCLWAACKRMAALSSFSSCWMRRLSLRSFATSSWRCLSLASWSSWLWRDARRAAFSSS